MTGRLDGKVALITGSDSGIGQATAIEFAQEGADVVVTYLHDADGAKQTQQAVEAAGQRAVVVQADLRDEEQVTALFDQATAEFGTLDILMNNAGVDASGTKVAELSTEVWDNALRSNLYAAFFCCRRFIQLRTEAGGGGKIINVTSVHEDVPNAGGSDYDCSKGAIRMLTRTLARALAPEIRVCGIAPGPVAVEPGQEERRAAETVLGRVGTADDVAEAILYLAGADFVTGTTLVVDGGACSNPRVGPMRRPERWMRP